MSVNLFMYIDSSVHVRRPYTNVLLPPTAPNLSLTVGLAVPRNTAALSI